MGMTREVCKKKTLWEPMGTHDHPRRMLNFLCSGKDMGARPGPPVGMNACEHLRPVGTRGTRGTRKQPRAFAGTRGPRP